MASGYWRRTGRSAGRGSRWPGFLRFYLTNMIKLCRFNQADELRGFGPSVRRDQLPLWSHAVLIFYAYFTIKLLVSLALQHQYNQLTWNLTTGARAARYEPAGDARTNATTSAITEANQTAPSRSEQQQQQQQQRQLKQAQLEITIGRLKLVGNAFYEFGAPIEPLYLLIVYIHYLSYLQPQIYCALRKPAVLDLLCAILDPRRHRMLVAAPDIERQASRYIKSSTNYLMTRLVGDRRASYEPQWTADRWCPLDVRPIANGHLIWRKDTLRALELAHEREMVQVAELLASEELVPPNRRPEQIERLARLHGAFIALISILSMATTVLVLTVLPRLRLTNIRLHNGPRDLLFQAELLCYCLLLIQSYIYGLSTIIATVWDHIAFVAMLERMTLDLGATSRLNDAAGTNRNLIRLVILYELLKKQLKSEQRDMKFVSANILILILTTPLMARLYVAQMALEYRYIYLASSVSLILGCDLVLLPFCRLHARCLKLLRARSRLLASIDAHLLMVREQKWSARRLSSLCLWVASNDEHTVHLLRRDQQVPELASRLFAVDAYFVRLTYASLLAVHFWCALLLAPMCLRDSARAPGASDNLLSLIF